jgi:hypothetical protein
VARYRCQVMLVTMLLSHAGAVLPSHIGDNAAGATWQRRDVDAE